MINSIYITMLPNEVTPKLLNLSTATHIEQLPVLPSGKVVLEYSGNNLKEVLDYTWFTAQEILQLKTNLEAGGKEVEGISEKVLANTIQEGSTEAKTRWWWPF